MKPKLRAVMILTTLFLGSTFDGAAKELSVYFDDRETYECHIHTERLHVPSILIALRTKGPTYQGFDFRLRHYFQKARTEEYSVPPAVLKESQPLLLEVLERSDLPDNNILNYLSIAASHGRDGNYLSPVLQKISIDERRSPDIRYNALFALGSVGREVSSEILNLLNSEDQELRFFAAWAHVAIQLEEPNFQLISELAKGLRSKKHWHLAYGMIIKLEDMSPNFKEIISNQLQDNDVLPKSYISHLKGHLNSLQGLE